MKGSAMVFGNILLNIDQIPNEYKLNEGKLALTLENLKSRKDKTEREIIVVKQVRAWNATLAVMEDIQLLRDRLCRLNVFPDIIQIAEWILNDNEASNLVDLSRVIQLIVEAQKSGLNGLRVDKTIAHAFVLLIADFRTSIHAWQLYDALVNTKA